MPFYYLRCGECCSAKGVVHAFERDPSSGRFVVVCRHTGKRTSVALPPDKRHLLDLPAVSGAFPLFHCGADGKGACPVRETWPDVCAEYECWRVLVVDTSWRRAGRVVGSRHLAVDDPALEAMLAPHRERLGRDVDDPD